MVPDGSSQNCKYDRNDTTSISFVENRISSSPDIQRFFVEEARKAKKDHLLFYLKMHLFEYFTAIINQLFLLHYIFAILRKYSLLHTRNLWCVN